MAYIKTAWNNGAAPGISAEKLNKIEKGIEDAHTLADTAQGSINTHILDTAPHGATSAPTASRLMLRDANGRAQAASPSAAGDVATKGYVDTADALKAPLASPALTGTPTAPTAAASTNNTQIATTAFAQSVAANARPYASGTYTGNGAASRIISLPFTPAAVFVVSKNGTMRDVGGSMYGGLAVTGSDVNNGSGAALSTTTSGFIVYAGSQAATNQNGGTYHYIAFR